MIKKFAFVFICFLLFFAVVTAADYTLSEFIVKASVEEGDSISSSINVLGVSGERFGVEFVSVENFISVNPREFELDDSGFGTFRVDLRSKDLDTGVYVGKIIVGGEEKTVNVPVILEVETFGLSPLFDAAIEISPNYKSIGFGDTLEFDVTVFKLKGPSDRVTIYYEVRNLEGETVFSETQNLDVSKQIRLSKSFELLDLELGEYVLSVSVKDVNSVSTGTSTGLFSIIDDVGLSPEEPDGSNNIYLYLSFFIILALVISFLFFNHYWDRKVAFEAKHWNTKLTEIKRTKFSSVAKEIRKLESQKRILEKAYDKSYIKKVSYEEGRKKINSMVTKLKKRL